MIFFKIDLLKFDISYKYDLEFDQMIEYKKA